MNRLFELKSNQHDVAASRRRWFYSPDMDLVVWYETDGSVSGFELYYDKNSSEHVFIWRVDGGFSHLAVDDGDQKPVLEFKEAPILIPDGHVDAERIKSLFEDSNERMPNDIAALVRRKLDEFPG